MSQFTQQQLQLNVTSKENPSGARRGRPEVPSLRQPVAIAKKPIVLSDDDIDSSDSETIVGVTENPRRQTYKSQLPGQAEIDSIDLELYVREMEHPRQPTKKSQLPVWATSMNLWKNTSTVLDTPESPTGRSKNTHKLHDQNRDPDEENRGPKRQKLATTFDDMDMDNLFFDEFMENPSGPHGLMSPDKARAGSYAEPRSPQPLDNATGTPGRANPSAEKSLDTADAIIAQNGDEINRAKNLSAPVLEETNVDPETSTNQPNFSEIVTRMRIAYMARHSVAVRQCYRWIGNPIDADGPPIREKPKAKEGSDHVHFIRGDSQAKTGWRFRSRNIEKIICTVEDIPVLVATVYCDPHYRDEKQLTAAILGGYVGLRREDIEWCLEGVRGEKAPATRIDLTSEVDDEQEPAEDSSLLNRCEETASSTNYLRSSESRDNITSNNSEHALKLVSSSLSSPAVTESPIPKTNIPAYKSTHSRPAVRNTTANTITNTAITNAAIANTVIAASTSSSSTTLTDLVHAYTHNTHKNYTVHLSTLTALHSQAVQKHKNQSQLMQTLQAAISDLNNTSALLRNRLSGPRRQSVGAIFDEEKAEKEAELVVVEKEVTRLEGEIERLDRERERVKGEERGLVAAARELRGELVGLLGWVDGLLVEEGDEGGEEGGQDEVERNEGYEVDREDGGDGEDGDWDVTDIRDDDGVDDENDGERGRDMNSYDNEDLSSSDDGMEKLIGMSNKLRASKARLSSV